LTPVPQADHHLTHPATITLFLMLAETLASGVVKMDGIVKSFKDVGVSDR
jgi:hypothetical protein